MLSNQFESPNEQKLQKGFDIKNCQNLDFVCKISWKFYFDYKKVLTLKIVKI